MPRRKPRYVLVALLDDDARAFNIIGPVTDYAEDDITHRVAELQKRGRNVRCTCTYPQVDINKVPSIESYTREWKAMGYTLDLSLQW